MAKIEDVLGNPSVSNWLKAALQSAIERDPVDAASDAEELAKILNGLVDDLLRQHGISPYARTVIEVTQRQAEWDLQFSLAEGFAGEFTVITQRGLKAVDYVFPGATTPDYVKDALRGLQSALVRANSEGVGGGLSNTRRIG